jgi:3',5'-cyclic AMP phosphodiesterase CpdA
MRTVVHLSDVHFGRVDYAVVNSLITMVNQIAPDVVVVSGDLTQRARTHQFVEARAFLDKLPTPQIVVPGNHDIPLYNVFDRFARPLDKYRKHITTDLRPVYFDEEIAILGINTARSLTTKYGRINESQIAWIQETLCPMNDKAVKIIVTHHPFDLPANFDERQLVGRSRLAMQMLATCGADVFLAGHLHVSHISHTATRYKIEGHSALVIQAGTATSTRGRGETNSFNIIRINSPLLTVERLAWQDEKNQFVIAEIKNFQQTPEGWSRVEENL